MPVEVPSAVLAHHKELCVGVLLQYLHGFLYGVLVIRPRKALVRRYHKAAVGPLKGGESLVGIEVVALHIPDVSEYPLYLPLQGVEVGPGVFQLRPGFSKLCGGDKVHGAGDLFGLLHALHMGLYLPSAGHSQSPAFPRYSERNFLPRSTSSSLSSSDSFPVMSTRRQRSAASSSRKPTRPSLNLSILSSGMSCIIWAMAAVSITTCLWWEKGAY